mmetsp:Transcript_122448/g.305721  ORF Transcript_122448/g.305721 Transcript_122448/m.305721 type:complete len:278 (+) Transcript_122448:314-1147(+)
MPALSEVVLPRYPDVATLAPIGAPGVLNLPIFVALLRPVFADAEAHQCNSMVNDGIPPAQVHDARIVDVPDSPCRDGDGHRALLDEGGHDGGELVLWELHIALHACSPRADNLVQACDPGSIRHGHSLGQGSLCSGATLRIVARVVRPLGVSDTTIAGDIIHGKLRGRTLAPTVASALSRIGRARHNLLHGEGPVLLEELRVSAKHCRRGKCPTTATSLLVLDLRCRLELRFPREVLWEGVQGETAAARAQELHLVVKARTCIRRWPCVTAVAAECR